MESNKLTGDNSFTVEPYLTAEVGVGVLYVLETGTSSLTEPVLVNTDDVTMALFLQEDTNRDVIQRTKLVYHYMIKLSGTWSELSAVNDDGTGENIPFVTENNGKISVSWINYSSSLTDESTINEALNTSSLCTASWDNDSQSFKLSDKKLQSSSDCSYNSMKSILDSNEKYTFVGIKIMQQIYLE